jgi:uncharacterized protein (TIGR02466 family)
METINLFTIPLFKFKYENHNVFKTKALNYLTSPECEYSVNNKNGLFISKPNLHRLEIFNDFNIFSQKCFEESMIALGYYPKIQITSLWATKHENNGSHHRHQHSNTFLIGVYYLSGNEKSSGTIFYNPNKNLINYMKPRKIRENEKRKRIMKSGVTNNFEEGTLIIFPSWIEHSTNINEFEKTQIDRYVLGINSMPLGPTNNDLYDRYNYQDISNVEMIENINDIFE